MDFSLALIYVLRSYAISLFRRVINVIPIYKYYTIQFVGQKTKNLVVFFIDVRGWKGVKIKVENSLKKCLCVYIQSDQKVSVHLMSTVKNTQNILNGFNRLP
jgi:hypothetical protein